MSLHIERDGTRALCEDEMCVLPIHLPLDTVEKANALPYPALLSIIEAFDPPEEIRGDGSKVWYNTNGRAHRDYDLPAVIYADGSMKWYQYGQLHRDYNRPAMIEIDGFGNVWPYRFIFGARQLPDVLPAAG